MEPNQTAGVNTGGFVPIETYKDKSTPQLTSSEGFENPANYTMKILPTVVKTLEEHFSFVASLVSIVGYIVISSFGHMDSFGKYLGYFIFLILIFFLYRFSQLKGKIEVNLSKTNWFFVSAFIILLIILIIQNNNLLISLITQFINIFKQTKK